MHAEFDNVLGWVSPPFLKWFAGDGWRAGLWTWVGGWRGGVTAPGFLLPSSLPTNCSGPQALWACGSEKTLPEHQKGASGGA